MPFPFIPLGAALALAVLGGAFAVFGAVLRLADRAALSARNTIAPTVVHGLRTWSHQPDPARPVSAPAAEPDVRLWSRGSGDSRPEPEPSAIAEYDVGTAIATERVRRH